MRKLAFHPAGNRKNLEKKKEQEKTSVCLENDFRKMRSGMGR